MRPTDLLSLGLILSVAAATPAEDKKATPPSKDSYVKVRVEVEAQGVLTYSDKAVTIAARERVYSLFNDADVLKPTEDVATVYTLDFSRAKDLRELAHALTGKDVVVAGVSELRMVMRPVPPGSGSGLGSSNSPPVPTWSLQRTVEVTSLKSAGGK